MLKRVTNIIDPADVNINTSMIVLNAANYKGVWEKPFYPQLTKDKKFYNLKGEIWKTPMMVTVEDVLYLEEPNHDIKIGISQIMNETHSGLHHILKRDSINKVYLSRIKQKVFLEIDEFGIRRPQRYQDVRDLERMQHFMSNMKEVALDRPFYFIISFRDSTGEYDLFHGVYYGPQEF
ncbi:unnamed protein product [Diatraea saccharalis]|uniref:Serpin domain-containing protein n=1 Tax=Diatraea saccharalis TaxID=40085 RepID=A0A9N9R831_9NEOP|nr:unnamed protein product [Diatraea saccharalis]